MCLSEKKKQLTYVLCPGMNMNMDNVCASDVCDYIDTKVNE